MFSAWPGEQAPSASLIAWGTSPFGHHAHYMLEIVWGTSPFDYYSY